MAVRITPIKAKDITISTRVIPIRPGRPIEAEHTVARNPAIAPIGTPVSLFGHGIFILLLPLFSA
jgi:hypothetical protein